MRTICNFFTFENAGVVIIMMADTFITSEGFLVRTAFLRSRFGDKYNQLLKKLVLTHYPKVGPPKSVKLYKAQDHDGTEYMHLPRTLSKSLEKILGVATIALPPIVQIKECPMQVELFENQRIVVEKLMEIFSPARIAQGTGCCILNLRAGMGKTFVAAEIISRLRFRTLYIVPKVPLAVQAVKDLRTCLYDENGGPLIIGGYHKKPKVRDLSTDPAKQDVTVICIDSAISRDTEFFSKYSLVVLDEIHTYCSDVRKKIFKLAGTWAMLGMSATTEDRADKFDKIAHKELAYDDIIRAESLPGFNYEGVNFKSLVTVVRYNGPPEYTQNLVSESTGKMFTPYMNKQFLRDPHRTTIAISMLRELYNWRGPEGQQHCIYVFCEEVEPLDIIYRGFIDSFGEEAVVAPEIGKFTGGIKEAQITNMKDNARIFLTTYGYSGTGVSIDKMTAIMFLTPRRANMKQILARILRRGGDQSITRRVIDIVDNKTGIKYQLGSRMIAYEYYGMEVEVKKQNVVAAVEEDM